MNNLIFVHGGMSFTTREEYLDWLKKDYVNWVADAWKPSEKKWRPAIAERFFGLGGRVFMPEIPCSLNAKYDEWLIAFNGLLATLEPESEIIFLGHSLGGCFLLKYFSEVSEFPYMINHIHLLAACISAGDFTAPENYDVLRSLGSKVHIWHAEDDMVVPFAVAETLQRELPDAVTHFFGAEAGYGHFHGIERLPELEAVIFG